MENIFENFRLRQEKEEYGAVIDAISHGVVFRGTNLWILVFAIFIASLGLNVNSTAVIIGAMLISPLMGPIMGIGMGISINDLALLRKSFYNYLFAAGTGLVTSTIYFSISPLREAHSEILARTAPTLYDVLIALSGGLAGILAACSKQKGNVIPGVAIATALMPPLCTAGYGLATFKLQYFFGAFYLFFINSVFIALATFITTRFLNFPYRHLPDEAEERRNKRIIWAVVVATILPSIYFAYDIVQRNNFTSRANAFIQQEAVFPNDYLLKQEIDPKKRKIVLTFGGDIITQEAIDQLKTKLGPYNLGETELIIQQGFAYLQKNENQQITNLTLAVTEREKENQKLKLVLDSLTTNQHIGEQIYQELKAQYSMIESIMLEPGELYSDSTSVATWLGLISSTKRISKPDQEKIRNWLKVRLSTGHLQLLFEP